MTYFNLIFGQLPEGSEEATKENLNQGVSILLVPMSVALGVTVTNSVQNGCSVA